MAEGTVQIVRLETDLVAPIPQILLVADHTETEYGPVKFQNSKVSMWLPQNADVYYDWRGRRFQRRQSFSNYLLSVTRRFEFLTSAEPVAHFTAAAAANRVQEAVCRAFRTNLTFPR